MAKIGKFLLSFCLPDSNLTKSGSPCKPMALILPKDIGGDSVDRGFSAPSTHCRRRSRERKEAGRGLGVVFSSGVNRGFRY